MSKRKLIELLCGIAYGELMFAFMAFVVGFRATPSPGYMAGYLFGSWMAIFALLQLGLAYTVHKKGVRC